MKNERKTNTAIIREAFAAGIPRNKIPGLTAGQRDAAIAKMRGRGEETYARIVTSPPVPTQKEKSVSRGIMEPVNPELVLAGFVLRGASETDIAAITIKKGDSEATEKEKMGIEFVKILAAQQTFGEDLSMWKLLGMLYQREGRPIPPNFFDRLRLEAFLGARLAQERDRNIEPLEEYAEAGGKVDRLWFDTHLSREEDFITTSLSTFNYYKGNDALGLYRIDPNDGDKKWRQPVGTGENGGFILDNLSEVQRRRKARES